MSEKQIDRQDMREGPPDDASRESNAVAGSVGNEDAGSSSVAEASGAGGEDAGKASFAEASGAGNEGAGGSDVVQENSGNGDAGAYGVVQENSGGQGSEEASFAALGLGAQLTGALAKAGILAPTSVQAGVIPELLAGRDGVLRSPTGSGKTLAYLLPLLQLVDPGKRETQAVVFAPTQELAMQIVRVSEQYGEPLGVKTVALIGGAALSRQLDRMKGKPAIVVGTPGRIREVVSLRKLPLHAVRHVVVDETDRVFSLGGKQDVEFVLKGAAANRQTVFVSATRSDTMRAAEAKWLRDPWETTVRQEQEPGLPQTIEHLYLVSDPRDKIDLVRRLIRTMKPASTLLFVNDIERIGELLAKLRFEGFAVDALYGDTPGKERGEVLRKFREGKTKLLIASDVAARGLDVPELALVLQFEPALDADHYVHRAGRTGRMGRSGTSITIVTPKETFIMEKLGKQLRIDIRERRLAHGRLGAAKGEARRESDEGAAKSQGGRGRPEAGQPSAGRESGPRRTLGGRAGAAGKSDAAGRPGAPGRSGLAEKPETAGRSAAAGRSGTVGQSGAAGRSETVGRSGAAGRSEAVSRSGTVARSGSVGPSSAAGKSEAPGRGQVRTPNGRAGGAAGRTETSSRDAERTLHAHSAETRQPRADGSGQMSNERGKGATRGDKRDGAGRSGPAGSGKGNRAAPAAKSAAKPGKVKEDRERDRKNKGAPRWLKEKRANNEPQA